MPFRSPRPPKTAMSSKSLALSFGLVAVCAAIGVWLAEHPRPALAGSPPIAPVLERGVMPDDDSCGAAAYAAYVAAGAAPLPSDLADHAGPGVRRLIRPGQPITQDMRRDRVNLDLDDGGYVTRIWCG